MFNINLKKQKPINNLDATWTCIFFVLFVASFLVAIGRAYIVLFKTSNTILANWSFSDWLINYQSGFIRRGLPGEIIYQLTRYYHFDSRIILFVLPIILLSILISILWCRAYNILPRWLLFCPTLMLFPVFDTWSAFRKDLLICLSLLICTCLFANSTIRLRKIAIVCISILTILSHEMYIIFVTATFVAISCLIQIDRTSKNIISLAVMLKSISSTARLLWPVYAIAILILATSVGLKAPQGIVNSLRILPELSNNDVVPSASIEALSWGFNKIWANFLQYAYAKDYGIPTFAGVMITMTLGALLNSVAIYAYKPPSASAWICFCVGRANVLRYLQAVIIVFLFTFPVYFWGIDYGRWIFLQLFSAFICFIEISRRSPIRFERANRVSSSSAEIKQINFSRLRLLRSLAIAGMLFYGIAPVGWTFKSAIAFSPLIYPFAGICLDSLKTISPWCIR